MKGPLAALASCVLIFVVLAAINAAMPSKPAAERTVATTRSPEYIVPTDTLGWRARPSTTSHVVKTDGDQVVFDVVYTFDDRGRRVVQDPNARYEKFLLFFGDSGTFGEGVDAQQTLPAQTASHLPGVHAYNYAFHGYGPQHVLAKVASTDLRADIAEPRGLALYPFNAFLLDRLIGGSRTLQWAHSVPYYTIDGDGVRRNGFYETALPIRSRLIRLIGDSPLMRRLNFAWPMWTTDAHRELFCRVIASARDGVRRQLAGSDLIVVLGPNDPIAPFPCFEKYELRVIDLRDAYAGLAREDRQLRGDPHPSPLAHERIGTALARELEPLLAALDK